MLDLSNAMVIGLRNTPEAVGNGTIETISSVSAFIAEHGPNEQDPKPEKPKSNALVSTQTSHSGSKGLPCMDDLHRKYGDPEFAKRWGADACLHSHGCAVLWTAAGE